MQVRSLPSDDMEPLYVGQSGIWEVTNIAIEHPLFSPNGDGYHDDMLFNADNYPRDLPGEDGSYLYTYGVTLMCSDGMLVDSTETGLQDYVVELTGEECAYNGHTDGKSTVTAKGCTEVQMANIDPSGTKVLNSPGLPPKTSRAVRRA